MLQANGIFHTREKHDLDDVSFDCLAVNTLTVLAVVLGVGCCLLPVFYCLLLLLLSCGVVDVLVVLLPGHVRRLYTGLVLNVI